MICLKIHADAIDPSRIIISICDSDLIGKKFEQGKKQLNITERFYKGELMEDEDAARIMKNSRNVNIVGKHSIEIAIKANIIKKGNVIIIKNIPHALVFE